MSSLFRQLLLLMALQMGVFVGAPMRPEEIRELLRQMCQPKIAHTLPDEAAKDRKKSDRRS
ncbi:MAG: hypothetical protein ABJF23_30605 [Bryobacteraceae bacterium]